MKYLIHIVLIAFWFLSASGQRNPSKQEIFISGFEKKIAGNEIQYTSGVEGVSNAIITRANTGKQPITWETAMVDTGQGVKKVTFVHYIGYDSRRPGAIFNFYVNDEKLGEIKLPKNEMDEWSLEFDNGSALHFKRHFIDGNSDNFGFLYYTVPAKLIDKGKPLKLEISGANEKSLTWLMVFKKDMTESLKVIAMPSIIVKDGKRFQTLLAEINFLNKPEKATLLVDGQLFKEVELRTGLQSIEILYPELSKLKSIKVQLKGDNIDLAYPLEVVPIRKWSVNFVQHSHTDIGYTRSQMEILAEHLRYIDYALDYCDMTDDFPEESKFRWTCEASWAVDEYLNSRSEQQINRLKQRIKEGRIEVTGMYFNFSELPDEQSLVASLAPLKSITEKGIPVTSAMQNDVNGIGWCMNDYFNSIDVKYLNMGTHGHKALISFDTPLAFWWISPSGKRMLAFRAEHYMIGNTAFGVHLDNFEYFERTMLRYLNKLRDKGYPYDKVAIQHSGFLTDNSPPSLMASDMIKKWNDKYEWPKIKTAVVSEFFEEIENEHGDELQEIQAHWPDWWTDGIATGAREVAATRKAHVDLIAGQGGLAMAKLLGAKMPKGIEGRIFETNKALLFYGEHTFGSAESISNPYSETSMEQREIKESYAWEATRRAKMIDEEALGLLNDYISKGPKPSMIVYNTLNWEREGLVTLYIDHQQIPADKKMRLLDEEGNIYPGQIAKPWYGGSYWSVWVEKIPAFGFKKFDIDIYEADHEHQRLHAGQTEHSHEKDLNFTENGNLIQLDNSWYSISLDKKKGVISQIYDKDLRQTLIDEDADYQLGEFILEKLGGREQLQSTMLPNGSRYGPLTDYEREPLDSVWLSEIRAGEIWNTISFKGTTNTAYEGDDAFSFDVRVFNTTKRIDFGYQIKKKPIVDPESFYIAFPFEMKGGKIHLEVAGGTMEAGVDQIPGSANDWNTIQNFVRIKNDKQQIVLVSPEAPLMQFGNINTGRFTYLAKPESNHLFSWPMNNYWTTNFNADQRGMYTWSYSFTSLDNNSNKEATKFSWGNRVPFLARVIPEGKIDPNKPNEISVLSGIPDNVLLINATPLENERALIFQFREIGNVNSTFLPESTLPETLNWTEVNVLGEEIKKVNSLNINALESRFYKLSW